MLVNVCYICIGPTHSPGGLENPGEIYNINYFMHKFSKIAKLPHGELML